MNQSILIGTQPGESDVVPFTGVGVINDVIVTGLRLQSGVVYYATIRGTLTVCVV